MTKNNTTPQTVQASPPEPDQFRVYDAINGLETFDLPKLSFSFNHKTNAFNLIVFNKNYSKSIALALDSNLNSMQLLQSAFEIIEKGIPSTIKNRNTKRNTRNAIKFSAKKAKHYAIAKSDMIFKYVDLNLLKELGNKILRNFTILIYEKPKIIKSDTEVNQILHQYHNTPLGGHLGINRLYRKLRPIFYWQNMKQIITEYVKKCELCKRNKHFTQVKASAIITTTPIKPFEVVSIDTIGPFPLSINGNRYAVSMQYDFTKFIILVPVPDKTAATMAKAIVEQGILIFGPTIKIKTHQGT